VAPKGTIDDGSLIAQSISPTISGTFSNAGALEVLIWKGKLVLPTKLIFDQKPIWRDFPDHGGTLQQCPISSASGRYSDDVTIPLQEGEYTVGVYTYDTVYTDVGYQGDTPLILIATGILKVIPK